MALTFFLFLLPRELVNLSSLVKDGQEERGEILYAILPSMTEKTEPARYIEVTASKAGVYSSAGYKAVRTEKRGDAPQMRLLLPDAGMPGCQLFDRQKRRNDNLGNRLFTRNHWNITEGEEGRKKKL